MNGKKRNTLPVVAVIVVVVLLIGGAYLFYPNAQGGGDGSGAGALSRPAGRENKNSAKEKGKLIARVDGDAVYSSELDANAEAVIANFGEGGMQITEEMKASIRRDEFARVVADVVIAQQAKALGVEVSDEELDAEVARIVEKIGGEDKLIQMIGQMGSSHRVTTIGEFKEWKRSDLNRVALIEKVGADVKIDEQAARDEFFKLVNKYEEDRDAGRQAVMPAGSAEEYIERMKQQARLVAFDKFINNAMGAAKIEILDESLKGAVEDYLNRPAGEPAAGGGMAGMPMGMHGSGAANPQESGLTNPHGSMPPGHPPVTAPPEKGSGA